MKGFLGKAGFFVLFVLTISTFVSSELFYLSSEQNLDVSSGDVFEFNVNGEDYSVTILDVYRYTIEFSVSNKLGTYQLQEKDFIEINLDDFGENDLYIKIESIIPRNKAKISIKKINQKKEIVESLPPGTVDRTSVKETEELEVVQDVENSKKPVEQSPVIIHPDIEDLQKEGFDSTIGYIIFIIFGLILIVLMITYIKLSNYVVAGVPIKLMDYVKKATKENMSEKDIKQELLKAGWSEEDIDAAFKKV